MTWQVIEADCLEAMAEMEADSIDAIVTDPPAGISFMGRVWDSDRSGGFVAWLASVMEEALRVTKPGGHALVWALPRTSHWTGSAIEAAGWEIRDRITHHFGSGFPKSLDVSKAIDRANGKHERDLAPFGQFVREARERKGWSLRQLDEAMGTNTAASWWEGRKSGIQPPGVEMYGRLKVVLGLDGRYDELVEWAEAEREKVGEATGAQAESTGRYGGWGNDEDGDGISAYDLTAPATPEAQRWQGWGTALKPATEDWWLARKPLVGTVAETVERFGTGALNIAATRISASSPPQASASGGEPFGDGSYELGEGRRYQDEGTGRWPANVCLSHLAECAPNYEEDLIAHSMEDGGVPSTADTEHLNTCDETLRGNYLCAPGCPVAELDRQSGERPGFSGGGVRRGEEGPHFASLYADNQHSPRYDDTGGASRFFATFDADVGGNAGLGLSPNDASAADVSAEPDEDWNGKTIVCPKCGSPITFLEGDEENYCPTCGCPIGWREARHPAAESHFRYVAKASRAERDSGLGIDRCTCETSSEWVNEDQPVSTPPDSEPLPPRATTAPTSEDGSEWSTTGSGSSTMDQSQMVDLSTTETDASRTTESRTSSSSTPSPTSDSTRPITGSGTDAGSAAAPSAESGRSQTRRTSTSRAKVGSATADADPATSESSSNRNSEDARCASCGGVIGGALRNAHPT